MTRTILFILFALFGALSGSGIAGHALAAPITFDFTGTAFFQSGVYLGTGTTAVTGSLTYDTALVDSLPADATRDTFLSTGAGNTAFVFSMTVVNGAVSVTLTQSNHISTRLFVTDGAAGSGDVWSLQVGIDLDNIGLIELGDLAAPFNLIGPGDGNLTGSPLPPTALDPTQAGIQQSFLFTPSGIIEFSIDSFSPAPMSAVPAPPVLPLLGAGLIAIPLLRRRRLRAVNT